MSIVSTQNSFINQQLHTANSDDQAEDAALRTVLLGSLTNNQQEQQEGNSMDRGAPEYSQSGLQSPYQSAFTEAQSEDSPADHASAAQYSNPQDVGPNSYSTSATPTSEYGVYPSSARSASFPDHIQQSRRYHTASNHSGSSGGMAQPQSPSMPLQDSRTNHQNQIKSDQEVPIDPSIAASSPTYPHSQYSPYPPQQEMQHGYAHPGGQMYAQPRPDWAGYAGQQHHGMPSPYQTTGVSTPTSAAPVGVRGPQQHPLSQVYSFVPIPGAQQHKRPRRRYEEIERMYKCGWNGCEKAYGTLNHLNAHVTMQSHGNKRTPEEFKEIRKEWKARKKEEENNRKASEERQRNSASQNGGAPGGPDTDSAQPAGGYSAGRSQVQLPPIGYAPSGQVPGQYQQSASGGVQQLQDYGHSTSNGAIYTGYPASPYGAAPQMYNQPNGNGASTKYEH